MTTERPTNWLDGTPVILRGDFPFTPGAFFDDVNLATLQDPQVRAMIPDLRMALETWYDTGDLSLIQGRCLLMPRSHLAPVFVMNAYGFIDEFRLPDGQKRPFMIVNHDPSFSAGDNAENLAKQAEDVYQTLGINELPQVLKTVTLRFNDKGTVLVSGIGDFRLDRETRIAIGSELGFPKSEARTATINPADFDTTVYLGLQPGMVKPILEPHLVGNVAGICYLKGRVKPEDFMAISVSHVDSIVMQARDFEFLFADYVADSYTGFGLTSTDGYDFYKNNKNLDNISHGSIHP